MASVKKSWINKYGEKDGLEKWEAHKKKFGRSKNQIIKDHGKKYYRELIKKRSTYSLDSCIKKYGKVIGELKWKERLSKKIETQRIRRESGVVYKNGRTLFEYQKRYGIKNGYDKWVERNRKTSYRFSKEYYINKYGKKEGEIQWDIYRYRIAKSQSLDYYISKYGKIDGKIKYIEANKRKAITEEKMIEKYGKALGLEKYKNWIMQITSSNSRLKNGVSRSSQKLFWDVYLKLEESKKKYVYFCELNKEFQFFINDKSKYPNKVICADFKIGNVIIEFDGAYWHNKNHDKLRDFVLIEKGYKIFRVDYNEYMKNENYIINKCLEFINENAQFKSI